MTPSEKPSRTSAGRKRFPNRKTPDIAPHAQTDLNDYGDRFRTLLRSTAEVEAARRAKDTVDDGDVAAAWRILLSGQKETGIRPLIIDAGLLLAGVFASTGVSMIFCDERNWLAGSLVAIAGVVIGAFAGYVRYSER